MPKQAAAPVYVGIDVSKACLDIHIHPAAQHLRVANDAGGWRRAKRVLAGLRVVRVVMEATSKYHRAAHRSLSAAGLAVAVVNPLRARLFAQACGQFAKTDAVDARLLAFMAERLAPDPTPPAAPALEAVQELSRARTAALAERVALGHRHSLATTAFLRTELTKRMRAINTHVARLEAAVARIITADPALSRRHTILCSIPGIGAQTATALIANMSELGQLSAKQAASLAGLAPFAQHSGPQKGARHIQGGRPHLRGALYMAALAAARFNPDMQRFSQTLRNAGKPPKVALVAVAQKL